MLTDGKARSRTGDGRVVDVTYRAGETRHFPGLGRDSVFVHDLTNTGETELVFVTVEFDPAYKFNAAMCVAPTPLIQHRLNGPSPANQGDPS